MRWARSLAAAWPLVLGQTDAGARCLQQGLSAQGRVPEQGAQQGCCTAQRLGSAALHSLGQTHEVLSEVPLPVLLLGLLRE